MAFIPTEVRILTRNNKQVTYFMDSNTDLTDLPVTPDIAIGSIAYTPDFTIYQLTTTGWVIS